MTDIERGREVVSAWGYKVNYAAGGTEEEIGYVLAYVHALEAVEAAARDEVEGCPFYEKSGCRLGEDCYPRYNLKSLCQALSALEGEVTQPSTTHKKTMGNDGFTER